MSTNPPRRPFIGSDYKCYCLTVTSTITKCFGRTNKSPRLKKKAIEKQKADCLLVRIQPNRTVSPSFNLERKNARYNNKEEKKNFFRRPMGERMESRVILPCEKNHFCHCFKSQVDLIHLTFTMDAHTLHHG